MTALTNPRFLLNLAAETIRAPRAGAAEVLRLAPDRGVLWLAFALMVTLGLIAGEIMTLMLGPVQEGPLTGQSSLVMGLLQTAILFVMIHAITRIGAFFGGTGSFEGALALIVWLQFIFLLIQAVQLLLVVIAPLVAALMSILAVGLFFYLLVNFIAELHGFASTLMVFITTIASFIVMVFLLTVAMSLLGVSSELTFTPA